MWTAKKVKKAMRMFRHGYRLEDIAFEFNEHISEVEDLLACTLPLYFKQTVNTLRVHNTEKEIEALMEYIPQATPFFKDIAIQRLKQLC